MNEEWRPVVGFDEGYEVSNLGRVRRIKYLRPGPDRHGYRQVSLFRSGAQISIKVHRLVAAAFIGELSSKLDVNHLNGVRDDNRVENLEITTRSGNLTHAYRVLGRPKVNVKGEAHPGSKLTDADVTAIRTRYANGESSKDLARDFGVASSHITNIAGRRIWKHLPGGKLSHRRRVTAEEVIAIRTRHANGERGVDLAREFGLKASTITCIVHRFDDNLSKDYRLKVTAADVMAIRTRSANGELQIDLAREFGITRETIRHIVRRRTWKHLP